MGWAYAGVNKLDGFRNSVYTKNGVLAVVMFQTESVFLFLNLFRELCVQLFSDDLPQCFCEIVPAHTLAQGRVH